MTIILRNQKNRIQKQYQQMQLRSMQNSKHQHEEYVNCPKSQQRLNKYTKSHKNSTCIYIYIYTYIIYNRCLNDLETCVLITSSYLESNFIARTQLQLNDIECM